MQLKTKSLLVTTDSTIQFAVSQNYIHHIPLNFVFTVQKRNRFIEGVLLAALREHPLRAPPLNTVDFKRTALRFLTAERLSVPSETYRPTAMTVGEAAKSGRQVSFQSEAAVRDSFGRNIRQGQPTFMWSSRSSWNNYRDHQTECFYCRRLDRSAKR
ncbi:unnamed protein product [Schistosoma margrebowiei]|uniref:Uncharacterized protein n=1 Tax=Schistosoma margrebowiei TaxID=48269 RepID=A0A183MY94_9TREM|nr:unnamed protein product [Schistosoma margrebowiei]